MAIRDDLTVGLLPTFTPIPEPATMDDGTPMPTPADSPIPGPLDEPASPRPERPDVTHTRTGTSSVGERARIGDPKQAAKIIGGLIGLAFVLASGVLSQWGRGRDVRRPTRDQTSGVAEPIARILARHTDLSAVTPDLADVIEAGAGVGEYLTDGPIVIARARPEYLDGDEVQGASVTQDPEPAPAPETPTVTFL